MAGIPSARWWWDGRSALEAPAMDEPRREGPEERAAASDPPGPGRGELRGEPERVPPSGLEAERERPKPPAIDPPPAPPNGPPPAPVREPPARGPPGTDPPLPAPPG